MKQIRLFIAALAVTLAPFAVSAQVEQTQVMERMDRIEHDLQIMQRQLARGESAPAATGDAGAAISNPAQLEVRLSGIEEQMRSLRGKMEENENGVRKMNEALDKFQKDTEFRFNELSAGNKLVAADAAAAKPGAAPAPSGTAAGASKPAVATADAEPAQSNFASPREHYNYAFRLLNQTQYEASAASFEAFTKKYPKDPLIGNAYYWEGETYYIRRDYVNASDNFRKGFESMPEGPKAADNLLKLAMSLDAMKHDKEACLVLQQISTKFKKSAASVADKAEQEQKRIGCSK